MSDDIDNGCIYKFVSKYPKDLTTGKLYVASLELKKWIPVDYDQHKILQENFDLFCVLIGCIQDLYF